MFSYADLVVKSSKVSIHVDMKITENNRKCDLSRENFRAAGEKP